MLCIAISQNKDDALNSQKPQDVWLNIKYFDLRMWNQQRFNMDA